MCILIPIIEQHIPSTHSFTKGHTTLCIGHYFIIAYIVHYIGPLVRYVLLSHTIMTHIILKLQTFYFSTCEYTGISYAVSENMWSPCQNSKKSVSKFVLAE